MSPRTTIYGDHTSGVKRLSRTKRTLGNQKQKLRRGWYKFRTAGVSSESSRLVVLFRARPACASVHSLLSVKTRNWWSSAEP